MNSSFEKLSNPSDVQDFLNSLRFNFEKKGETCRSVEESLRIGEAHCFEGALIAACALERLGHKPLLLDLKTTEDDFEHVVAPFRINGYWGAISKTNHSVLRYREPVYRTIRELVMSYFHEYFLNNGRKTLRSYSKPFNLKKFGRRWIESKEDLWDIDRALDQSPHLHILSAIQIKNLRPADPIEIEAGKIIDHV